MRPTSKIFLGNPLLFWIGQTNDSENDLNISLKDPLPAYRKLLSVPAGLTISYSQKGNVSTVLVDLNEEIHSGRVILQTYMLNGRIVSYDTPGGQWATVNKSGETPMDGIYAWSFLPEEMGEYHFRARFDADGPDCPFDSVGWTEAEAVLLN